MDSVKLKRAIRFIVIVFMLPIVMPIWTICEWLEEDETTIKQAFWSAYELYR